MTSQAGFQVIDRMNHQCGSLDKQLRSPFLESYDPSRLVTLARLTVAMGLGECVLNGRDINHDLSKLFESSDQEHTLLASIARCAQATHPGLDLITNQ